MALPERSGVDVVGLANLFLGKNSSQTGGSTSQNSGGVSTAGTVTTSESVSPEAVNAVVKSILEGNQGLAAVSSGQRRSGLYNSTTNQMLTNDLIARAAAEGAKLNKTSTQVTNNVQSDTRSTVGTTTQANNTKAQVNPGKAAGAVGLLQLTNLIPKDMKASILDKVGLGGKGKTGTAASTAPAVRASGSVNQAIDDAQAETNAPTYANNPSAFVAGMDPSQAGVGAIGTSMDSQSIESFLSTPDLAGFENGSDGIDIGNFGSAVDVGFDSNSVGGSLGDISGIGSGIDTSNIGYDPSFDFEGFDAEFGDFDLGFADGGLVNIRKYGSPNPAAEAAFNSGGDDKSEDKPVQKTAAKEEDKTGRKSIAVKLFDYINNRGGKVPAYAEGGLVKLTHDSRGRKNQYADPRSRTYVPEFGDLEKSPGYATGGMVDLTNLGLRKSGPQYSSPLGVSSNTQSVSGMKSQEDKQSPVSGTRSTNATSPVRMNVNRTRASTPNTDLHTGNGDASGPGTGTTPGAADSGLGMSPGVAGAVGIGLSSIGVPGAVTGLANASNNTQAVNSVVSSVASALAGPVAGLVVNALLSNISNPDSLDNAAATASANNSAPSNSDTAAAVANSIAVDENMDPLDALVGLINNDSTNTSGAAALGGVSDSEGFGVSASDGSSVGSDGDGGVGAGGAFKQGGSVEGPGTATSDSIMARLSDGEFVHKASAVKTFGEPFMEAVNDEDPVKALELLLTSGLIKSGPKGKR